MARFSFVVTLALIAATVESHAAARSLDRLARGEESHGFRAVARFLNDDNAPMGARFTHVKTGFTFDVLRIASVPQGFVWVRSFPTSDKGEPHTQEHLLLGKGNKGKYVANVEGMSLVTSSAYTEQWHTCYHFYTLAGVDVFFDVLKDQLDALLHPDYSDEEIRREVCNFGVTEDPSTHVARLEEKGTVYNEMVSSYERPWSRTDRALQQSIYGEHHPMSYESGGLPSAIRTMTPQDIRTFHANAYHLANMGMVGSFAPDVPLDSILAKMDAVLNGIADRQPSRVLTEADLPAPAPGPRGTIHRAEFPDDNEHRPSPLEIAWPAERTLDAKDKMLLDLFVQAFAGDATTNLYKLFIDTKTRVMDIGADNVFGWVSDDLGHPVYIGFETIDPVMTATDSIARIRSRIVEEFSRIGHLADGSAELRAFNDRIASRVTESRRAQRKFVNAPPGFGFRGGGSGSEWMNRLNLLTAGTAFDVHVTLADELAHVDSLLATGKNFWSDCIARWKLTETPYAAAAIPSPALLQRESSDRAARAAAEVARLKAEYHASDDAATIAHYRALYDRTSAELDSVTALVKRPGFIAHPPLTLDDGLAWAMESVPPATHEDSASGDLTKSMILHHVRMLTSTFPNMTGATVGISVPVRSVPGDGLYLSLLPQLMTEVGVIENGVPVSNEEVTERQRREILGISASYDVGHSGHSTRLVVRGSGNTIDESRKAIGWMNNVLYHPDWRPENLARIRDVVDHALASLRHRMQGSEESWVRNPAEAYRRQTDPDFLATSSFLTQGFNALRLRWQLKDVGDAASVRAFSEFLDHLRNAGRESDRAGVVALLGVMRGDAAHAAMVPPTLAPHAREAERLAAPLHELAKELAGDLDETLSGMPDGSLAGDWDALCSQIRSDVAVGPRTALGRLDTLRRRILRTEWSHMFFVGSSTSRAALDEEIRSIVAGLDTTRQTGVTSFASDGSTPAAPAGTTKLIVRRLAGRLPAASPLFVGLVNPNTQSGVFLNSAGCPGFEAAPAGYTANAGSLMKFLSTKMYGGHGSHSMFMKTWAAGLAYSNGLSSSAMSNRVFYYAERCPELPQTLSFVIDELKKAPRDPALAEYSIAQVFGDSRAAESFESRGEGMAHQVFVEGLTQEQVRAFRTAILDLRDRPDLVDKLYDAMPRMYGSVLPGYDNTTLDTNWGTYFVIGSEKQMQLYEAYLRSRVNPDTQLYRLWPRDFWMTE